MDTPKSNQSNVEISVVLLNNTEVVFKVNKRDRGQILLDLVFQHLGCQDTKYFSLQFPQEIPDSMRWLDPSKSIRKQFKRGYPSILFYRVKYYITDLNLLKDDYTRFQMYLQCKLDLLESRLLCSMSTAAFLSSLALQSELGDYVTEAEIDNYIQHSKFIPNQTKGFEEDVKAMRNQHRGMTPAQAQYQYLLKAKTLKRYGMDVHIAKSNSDEDLEIGVTANGVRLYHDTMQLAEYKWVMITKISFKRKQFYIHLQRKTQKNPDGIETFSMDNYRSCKRLWKSCVDFHSFYRLSGDKNIAQQSPSNARSDKTLLSFLPIGSKNKLRDRPYGNGLPAKSSSTKMLATVADSGFKRESCGSNNEDKAPRRLSAPPSMTFSVIPKANEPDLSSINMYQSYYNEPAHVIMNKQANSPKLIQSQNQTTDNNISNHSSAFDIANNTEHNDLMNQNLPDDVFLIRLKPDNEGRFGFNIKGGYDQGMGIIVSKVAQNFPADLHNPRLNEGDEILQINGRDITNFSHEQAVMFIRATREGHSGELVMLVKPHVVYEVEDNAVEEEMASISSETQESLTLHDSMLHLYQRLASGEAVLQFERLYRRNPDLSIESARQSKNIPKNRYRDISPYDSTRVILHDWETDYINASHINMCISGTDIVNRYIACQGPLENTSGDFWEMVWEQEATLVVMVTALRERNQVKCFRYWPEVHTMQQFQNLTVECVGEDVTSCFAFRQFTLSRYNEDKDEEVRNIMQMQYIAWPDHGVPEDSSDFLDFILQVRQRRVGMSAPTIVHCSAGIGRTGVMISMETAMCLIEANQAVDPIGITRVMRDQRAMMIQTPAILRVYEEGLAKPDENNQSDAGEKEGSNTSLQSTHSSS